MNSRALNLRLHLLGVALTAFIVLFGAAAARCFGSQSTAKEIPQNLDQESTKDNSASQETAAPQGTVPALLDLIINQVNRGEVTVVLRGNDVLIPVKKLSEAGFVNFGGFRENFQGEEYVSLLSLSPGLSFRVNDRDLTLDITAQPSMLQPTVEDFGQKPPPGIRYSKESSAFFNYALNGTDLSSYRLGGEFGVSKKGRLLYSSIARNLQGQWSRGLSNYTIDNPDRLLRVQLGDALGQSGDLGGGATIGGLHYSRNYSLNPYFYRYPTFQFRGTTLYPATADIYVNNVRVQEVTLPPGNFQLNNLPVTSGQGNARVIIRDILGHEQELTRNFYFDTTLLAKGATEFNYDFGFRRDDLTISNYGALAFFGQNRIGLTPSFTGGARFEWSPGIASGGPTFAASLPVGSIGGSAALSSSHGIQGQAISFGYNFSNQALSFSTLAQSFSSNYANLSLPIILDRPRYELDTSVGFPIGSNLSMTLLRSYRSFRDQGKLEQISASGFMRLSEPFSLLFTVSRTFQAGVTPASDALLSLNYAYSQGANASVSFENVTGAATVTEDIQKPLTLADGFAYHLQKSEGSQALTNTDVEYQGPHGRYGITTNSTPSTSTTAYDVSGGIAAVGGGWFFSRTLTDAFALVRVPGMKGIRVSSSNQEVTRTDSHGDAIVPNLVSYYGNRLEIGSQDIPMVYTFLDSEAIVAPSYRAGTMVLFPVTRLQAATGKVMWVEGTKSTVPVYGELTVVAFGHHFESPVGNEGEFYFENLPAGVHPATLTYRNQSCDLSLKIPVSPEAFLDLGMLECHAAVKK